MFTQAPSLREYNPPIKQNAKAPDELQSLSETPEGMVGMPQSSGIYTGMMNGITHSFIFINSLILAILVIECDVRYSTPSSHLHTLSETLCGQDS